MKKFFTPNAYAVVLLATAYLPAGYLTSLALKHKPSRHKDGQEEIKVGVLVSAATQKEVAYHEAGHALVMYHLAGASRVGPLAVRTVTDESGLLGTVGWGDGSPATGSLPQILNITAVRLGGRAADKYVNGAADSGSRIDLQNATDELMPYRLKYGLGGTLVVKENPSDTDYAAVADLMARANDCAEGLVVANIETVKALGELVLAKRPDDGARTLSNQELRAFFKDHPIVPATPPASLIETGDDPCLFDPEY